MKHPIIAFVVSLAFVAPARAEPMKLTVNQAYSVAVGIAQLDKGFEEPAKDNGKDVVLHRAFAFGPAVRIALAVDGSRIGDAIASAQKELKAARENVSPNGGELDAEARKALDAEIEKIGARILEIELTPISESDLALDKNVGISAAAIQALLPIFRK
ncbi:MAG: hypothetical protein WB816_01830 [Methylocystis sp.]